ncbi:MAG: hypothetical protein HY329_25720 [Chloroflexi bacterium]|nr:hypothetical protein [Chloroflexota bacterium]
MSEFTIATLADRLEQVEKHNQSLREQNQRIEQSNRQLERSGRRWRQAGLGAIVLASLIALGGATHAVRVEAQAKSYAGDKYDVVNQDGKTRGRLAVTEDGNLGLALFSGEESAEKIPSGLFVTKEGDSGVLLTDGGGDLRVVLSANKDASSGLSILDKKGIERVSMQVGKDGEGKITIKNASGGTVWSAP